MVWEQVLEKFKELFGGEGDIGVYFAPGRVNLIGEHTDYNGGHVFPCALTIGTYGAVRKRADKKLRFYSMNFECDGVIESSIEALRPEKEAGWTNYPKGVIWAFGEHGMKVEQGMDLVLFGNIPNGSGLSSSASVEALTGFILKDLFGFDVSGAGFGGCTVSLVKDEAVDSFLEKVGEAYRNKIGYAADFYVVEIGGGPEKIA